MIALLIIIILLLVIAAGICKMASAAKQRYIEEHPARYYFDAGIIRMFAAIVLLPAGVGFPPLWLLSLILFAISFHCFAKSSKLRKSLR